MSSILSSDIAKMMASVTQISNENKLFQQAMSAFINMQNNGDNDFKKTFDEIRFKISVMLDAQEESASKFLNDVSKHVGDHSEKIKEQIQDLTVAVCVAKTDIFLTKELIRMSLA